MQNFTCNSTEPLRPVSYYPERPVEAIIGMLSFFCLLGSMGNAVVIYVYARKKNKLPSTIFIISLAGTDLSVCLMVMPYTMAVEYLDYELKYDFLCKLYFFLITCNVPFSAFIMVAIAVDRYICICHPHLHILDARRARLTLITLVFIVMFLGIITALANGVYRYISKEQLMSTISISSNDTMANNTISIFEVCDNMLVLANCSGWDESYSNCTVVPEHGLLTYTGVCSPNQLIFSRHFRKTYQKLYACIFLVAFIIVFVLYILIYKSVLERRSKKLRQRQKTQMSLCRETSFTETQVSVTNGSQRKSESKRGMIDRDGNMKEKYWLANIRTALMLFVVTVVFICAFLPSWLMAHKVVPFVPIVFYLYFAYNVSNPIIYAFMNPAFRRELKDLISCRKCKDNGL